MTRRLVASHTALVLLADLLIAAVAIASLAGAYSAAIAALLGVGGLRSAAFAIRRRVTGGRRHTSRHRHSSRSRT